MLNGFTEEQVSAGVQAVAAIAEAIRGLGEVPSGKLYAHVCGTLSLEAYEGIVALLKRAGLVEERSNVLTWVGPPVGG